MWGEIDKERIIAFSGLGIDFCFDYQAKPEEVGAILEERVAEVNKDPKRVPFTIAVCPSEDPGVSRVLVFHNGHDVRNDLREVLCALEKNG